MPLYDSSTSRTKFHACCCPTNSRRARSSNRSFTSSRLTALRHAANALTTPKLSMGVAQFCWSTFFGQFCCCSRSQPAKRAVKSSEPHASRFHVSLLSLFSSSLLLGEEVSPASSWFACGAVTLVDLLRFLMLLHNCCCLAFLKTNRCVGLGLSLSFPAQFSHLVWDPLTMGQGLCATVPVSPAPPPSPKRGLPQPQRATPAPPLPT